MCHQTKIKVMATEIRRNENTEGADEKSSTMPETREKANGRVKISSSFESDWLRGLA